MEAAESELEVVVGFSETCQALGLQIKEALPNATSSLETPRVVVIVSSLLERSARRNERLLRARSEDNAVTIFHGTKAPQMSVGQYCERIFRYSNCSPSCFVVSQIYIERFVRRYPGFRLTSLNVHRLLIASVMVAAKFLDDTCENNAHYAAVGGVSNEEMNELEVELLFRLDFRLQVTAEFFAQRCRYLEQEDITAEENPMTRQSSRLDVNRIIAACESYGCRTM